MLLRLGQLAVTAAFWADGGLVRRPDLRRISARHGVGGRAGGTGGVETVAPGADGPLVAAVKTVPVASFIILALVWLNSQSLSLFISALMVFPPVYLNVLEGICRTDRRLLEMARVFRVPFGRRLRGIYLPQVMPYFRTAVSLGLGLCWKAGAAAEIIGLPAGSMGERLYTAKVYFQTADLFAWTVTIVAVSVAFERLFLALVDRLMGKAGL